MTTHVVHAECLFSIRAWDAHRYRRLLALKADRREVKQYVDESLLQLFRLLMGPDTANAAPAKPFSIKPSAGLELVPEDNIVSQLYPGMKSEGMHGASSNLGYLQEGINSTLEVRPEFCLLS
jgi:hypothetical protein